MPTPLETGHRSKTLIALALAGAVIGNIVPGQAVAGELPAAVKALVPVAQKEGKAMVWGITLNPRQIAAMNKGEFLEELLDASPTDFCIGAAAYPEKHVEAPNLAADVAWVKQKVDAGASYVVTQMFFDNAHYYQLVDECLRQEITVPIIPGLKTITTKSHLTSIPTNFHCEIPVALAEAVTDAADDQVVDVGVAWAVEQSRDLIDHAVPAVHFYVMGNARAVGAIIPQLKL